MPSSETLGNCNYPREDNNPCEMPLGHIGLHRIGLDYYGDDGKINKMA